MEDACGFAGGGCCGAGCGDEFGGEFGLPVLWVEKLGCGLALADLVLLQAFLYDHDSRFFVGWELDKSWILCTVSWSVLLLDLVGVVGAALFMPSEDDYEPIPEAPPRSGLSARSGSYRG